jgi:hypothetical protein
MVKINENTFKAESWIDLQKYLFNDYNIEIDRHRSNYAYRGISDFEYRLETSLQRIGRKPSVVEDHLIRSFQKYAPINTLVDNYNSIWNWISLGQHHGLPTRLLDWTFSPNIALHFMTDDFKTFGKDGMIWKINYVELAKHLPEEFKTVIKEKNILTFTSNELRDIIGNSIGCINNFTNINGDGLIFFEPPSIDDRIVNQFAMFSFMLNPNTDKQSWLEQYPSVYEKIIIPADLKWEIRDKLDQANITERMIYPGLDGISKWVTRWYSEKNEDKRWKSNL